MQSSMQNKQRQYQSIATLVGLQTKSSLNDIAQIAARIFHKGIENKYG